MKHGLRELLSGNMKKQRGRLGLSQAKLAEKANLSSHFIAMIELRRKFPTPETLESIADALGIDPAELFSIPPSPAGTLKKLHSEVLTDIEQAVNTAVEQAVRTAVGAVISGKVKELESED
jgi:transcriptional regulator with XRE-family HTH domain